MRRKFSFYIKFAPRFPFLAKEIHFTQEQKLGKEKRFLRPERLVESGNQLNSTSNF